MLTQPYLQIPQAAVHVACREFFPNEFTTGLKFTCIKDLENKEPSATYFEFWEQKNLDAGARTRPQTISKLPRGRARAAVNDQEGTVFAKEAVPQPASLRESAEARVGKAKVASRRQRFPVDAQPIVEFVHSIRAYCKMVRELRAVKDKSVKLVAAAPNIKFVRKMFSKWQIAVAATLECQWFQSMFYSTIQNDLVSTGEQ